MMREAAQTLWLTEKEKRVFDFGLTRVAGMSRPIRSMKGVCRA